MAQKNKMFDCRENDEADLLFCMIEATSVLSESFTQKVINIGLVIITNLPKNNEWVSDSILKLKEEMNWLCIFSDRFIGILISQLTLAYQKQLQLNQNL